MKNLLCSTLLLLFCLLFVSISISMCWRAVPANQAMYALRARNVGARRQIVVPDDLLPRTTLNNVYKFGWCRPDVISPQFMRKSVNITLKTWQDTQAEYLYLLERKHTQRYRFQCIVMKTYVNRKYLFYKSRLPLYYCQGEIFIVMMNTVDRLEVHEFYLYHKLNMPANFVYEFYHAPPL
ncbi:uncharacterized protein [Epargyreus clarus]|uniref:uncharacterized protein n=1 Tax=Epargyreus clarus TaxID=520877 RepID=UPI003C2CD681